MESIYHFLGISDQIHGLVVTGQILESWSEGNIKGSISVAIRTLKYMVMRSKSKNDWQVRPENAINNLLQIPRVDQNHVVSGSDEIGSGAHTL